MVYIGVQGQTDTVKFTILVWDQLFDPVDAFIDVIEGAHRGVTIYDVSRNFTSAASQNTYVQKHEPVSFKWAIKLNIKVSKTLLGVNKTVKSSDRGSPIAKSCSIRRGSV